MKVPLNVGESVYCARDFSNHLHEALVMEIHYNTVRLDGTVVHTNTTMPDGSAEVSDDEKGADYDDGSDEEPFADPLVVVQYTTDRYVIHPHQFGGPKIGPQTIQPHEVAQRVRFYGLVEPPRHKRLKLDFGVNNGNYGVLCFLLKSYHPSLCSVNVLTSFVLHSQVKLMKLRECGCPIYADKSICGTLHETMQRLTIR